MAIARYSFTRFLALIPLCLITSYSYGEEGDGVVEEVIVTGSYLKKTTADSPTPLTVIGRADIEDIGAVTVSDLVQSLTFNSGSVNRTNAFDGGDSSTGNVNINLRNMGLGSTLVLINGHRSAQTNFDETGNGYVDLGGILPNIALERVEVVKDGASALYGSDAIAGVVNFITRDDYEGFEFEVGFQTDDETKMQDDKTFAAIMGVGNDEGNITIAFSHLDRDPLQIGNRFDTFGKSGISTFGQPGRYVALGAITPNPNPLNPAGSTAFGGGADLDCDLAISPNGKGTQGGPFCAYDFSSFFNLVGQEERTKVFGTGHYQIADNIEIYGDIGFSDNFFLRGNSLFPDVTFAVIPPNHPGLINDANRRGIQPVPYLALQRLLGGDNTTDFADRPVNTDTTVDREFFRANGGTRIDFDFGDRIWTLDASVTRSERNLASDTRSDTLTSNTNAAYAGLGGPLCDPLTGTPGSGNAGTGNCFYYNPFASSRFKPDGSPQDDPLLMNPTELLQWMAGEIQSQVQNRQTVYDFVFTGDLFDMSAGTVQLAVGAQWRKDETRVDNDKNLNNNNYKFVFGAQDWNGSLTTRAAFAEISLPLMDTLELNIAGRFEDFDEIDENTFDPKFSLLWTPTQDLSVRGSYGSSFRVGSLLQLFGQNTSLLNSSDAFSGTGGLAFRPTLTDGNPDLKPEKADAFNIGFSWAPSEGVLEGVSVDVDYYNFEVDDILTKEAHQVLINQDNASRCPNGVNTDPLAGPLCGAFDADGDGVTDVFSIGPGIPDKVIRGPDGSFLRTQASYLNAQSLDTSGIDFTLAYQFSTENLGLWKFSLNGSWTIEYDLVDPFGTKIDGVGSRNKSNTVGHPLPEYKLNGMIGWGMDRHAAVLFIRYIDGYKDDQTGPSALRAAFMGINVNDDTIDSMTTYDAQYTYQVPALFGFQEEGSVLTLGIKNLTNEDPPVVNVDGAYDPFTHDPRGRMWYLKYKMVI